MINQSILIVDDDEALRELVVNYLENSGYALITAGDGIEMRAQLQAHTVDLIVLDLMLPGEDGLSLLKWVRIVDPEIRTIV